jgi:hypothetical protein
MGNKKIRKKVTRQVKIAHTVRPDLYLTVCDVCKKRYQIMTATTFEGTFDQCVFDRHGRGMGNSFYADVCSLECGAAIAKGGWKNLKRYKPFVKAGAVFTKVEVKIGRTIDEATAIQQWEAIEDKPGVSNGLRIRSP